MIHAVPVFGFCIAEEDNEEENSFGLLFDIEEKKEGNPSLKGVNLSELADDTSKNSRHCFGEG